MCYLRSSRAPQACDSGTKATSVMQHIRADPSWLPVPGDVKTAPALAVASVLPS